jgi:hypothetical protein
VPRSRRDLLWVVVMLALAGVAGRHFSRSHDLDGKFFQRRVPLYAHTDLRFDNGTFNYFFAGCTHTTRLSGTYWVDGDRVKLLPWIWPTRCFV